MNTIIFGTVKFIGPLVSEFINEGILVFFGLDAPEELKEFSIIWDIEKLVRPLKVDDYLFVDGEKYKILGVGEIANKNLKNLGHLIIKFNGKNEINLPGDVNVEQKPVPPINKGSIITVKGN